MALPGYVPVKISSEAAEYVSLTPVVNQSMLFRELAWEIVAVTGKDLPRIHDLLRRGSLVSGASRLRWEGMDVDADDLELLIAGFPDPEPDRRFDPALCRNAVLRAGGFRFELPRDVGDQRRMFRSRSFWDALMQVAEAAQPRYVEYSYRERADRYAAGIAPELAERLRREAKLLCYSKLVSDVRRHAFTAAEFLVAREELTLP